jgi:hypothetical protein
MKSSLLLWIFLLVQTTILANNPNNPPLISPIIIREFKVSNFTANKVYVAWETLKEFNNREFIIERSLDGDHFSIVGVIRGADYSEKIRFYEFIDESPKIGKNIYRLKQVDSNGEEHIINQVSEVRVDKIIDDFMVVPVPTTEDIELSYMAFKSGLVSVKIFNKNGYSVKDFFLLSEEGLNNFQIDLSDLDMGEYTIILSDFNSVSYSDKIIKSL